MNSDTTAQDIRARLSSGGGRWVVKIGSALATNEGQGINTQAIEAWADELVALQSRGTAITIVTSGAIAEGIARMAWNRRPHKLSELQAAAAIGQMGLVRAYDLAFRRHGKHAAQVLLTHADLANRERYLNARSALLALLDLGVFPVINENDTVATDEIRFGDNDTLAGLVSNLLEADLLLILTDQAGLYTADPRTTPDANLIETAEAGDPSLEPMAGAGGGTWGRGGMITKLRAAAYAARSGTSTIIADGRAAKVIARIASGERVGTLITAAKAKLAARKQWLAGIGRTQGSVHIDAGAARVIAEQGKSLLPVGVKRVDGNFARGALVSCLDPDGKEVARGLINYSADDARKIAGLASAQIEDALGYVQEPELIHRDNLVLTTLSTGLGGGPSVRG
jgi:glutamate 5-kinase